MTILRASSQAGCNWNELCIEICDADPVYVTENAAEAYFENPRDRRVRKIHHDNCYCRDQSLWKADLILGSPHKTDIIIELKGADLAHADAQVESTPVRWKDDPHRFAKIAGLIIHSRREASLKREGVFPRWRAQVASAEARLVRTNKALLLIRESSVQRFRFKDFLQKSDDR